jgi:transcriptional regulator with XRE-family HTH domain
MSYRRALTGEGLIMLVSSNIKRLRFEAGLTATEAAKRGGMLLRTWQKIEAGDSNTTMRSLSKVCVALDVDAQELLRKPPKKS